MMKRNVIKMIWMTLGTIFLVIGCIGMFVPILPSFPFFLATLFCFGHSSERLKEWFMQSDLYKKNLESYVRKEGMLLRTKLFILCCVTLTMGIGFWFMRHLPMASGILAIVWFCHVLYFMFCVKTKKE